MLGCAGRFWSWLVALRTQDLLREPLKAEFIFHVRHDGEIMLYSSKTDATQAELGRIIQGIIQSALVFAKNQGIFIEGQISNRDKPQ